MAQTGYTPILNYSSATASAVPLAANLAQGELALNTNDGKLFYKDSAGVVQTMASKATGSIGGSTTQVQFNNSGVLGGSASLTWSGTVLTSSGFAGPLNGTVGATTAASGAFTTVTTSGDVGIGTSSPATKLQVYGGALTVGNESTYAARFGNNSNKGVTIGYDTTNNVGHIGSINPAVAWTDLVINANGGNLGLGVTPSAWGTAFQSVIETKNIGVLAAAGPYISVMANAFYNSSNQYIYKQSAQATHYAQAVGAHQWFTAASGTAGNPITFTQAMTLDANGALNIAGSTNEQTLNFTDTFNSLKAKLIYRNSTTGNFEVTNVTNAALVFGTNNTERMRLDSSGNLGLGVTPSAYGSTYKAYQAGVYAAFVGDNNNGRVEILNNAYASANNVFNYTDTNSAGRYSMQLGAHAWYTAPSGTAGNPITFTQAMTLDASGQRMLGITTPWGVETISKTVDNGSAVATNISAFGGSVSILHNQDDGAGGNKNGLFFAHAGSPGIMSGVASTKFAGSWRTSLDFYVNNITGGNTGDIQLAGRFDPDGNLLVGTTSGSTHIIQKSNASSTVLSIINSSATSPSGTVFNFSAAAPNNGTQTFFTTNDTGGYRGGWLSNGGVQNYQSNDSNLSDRREKTNFLPAKSYLDVICSIPVQTFNYVDQNMEEDGGLTLGVVAQDVQAVAPELVMESNWGTKDEPKMRLSIYQTDLQYALMKCIQEQQALIQDLTTRLAALEAK
jgi:hypothetical protein